MLCVTIKNKCLRAHSPADGQCQRIDSLSRIVQIEENVFGFSLF